MLIVMAYGIWMMQAAYNYTIVLVLGFMALSLTRGKVVNAAYRYLSICPRQKVYAFVSHVECFIGTTCGQ